jgi:hypothetical protein
MSAAALSSGSAGDDAKPARTARNDRRAIIITILTWDQWSSFACRALDADHESFISKSNTAARGIKRHVFKTHLQDAPSLRRTFSKTHLLFKTDLQVWCQANGIAIEIA